MIDAGADLNARDEANGATPLHRAAKPTVPETLTLPLIGQVNLKYLSLGALTVIIGALDGFNPCAMWVLIFLINLLLGMEDRRKMWVLGSAFIIASGAVYFLFMTAWLNLLVFLGFIFWVRIIIGLVALFAGGYNLKEYWTDVSGACTLSHGARRQRTIDRQPAPRPQRDVAAGQRAPDRHRRRRQPAVPLLQH